MIIKDSFISRKGVKWNVEYTEVDTTEELDEIDAGSAGAFCFYNNKLVLVYAQKRAVWEIPGGSRERAQGENITECIIREIKEESNMKVLELIPIAYEVYTSTVDGMQLRTARFAARVEPYGDFVADPDEDITEIKLINPKDYKQYFDWGERGDVMLRSAMEKLNIK